MDDDAVSNRDAIPCRLLIINGITSVCVDGRERGERERERLVSDNQHSERERRGEKNKWDEYKIGRCFVLSNERNDDTKCAWAFRFVFSIFPSLRLLLYVTWWAVL